jgi:hypothetical protein
MVRTRFACALALVAITAFGLSAQTAPRRVTVATVKGDTIEGTYRSISDTAVVIEIAGSPISIPLVDVTYVSFTGKLDAGGGGAAPAVTVSPMDAAFAALKKLRGITEIGALRDQYSAAIVDALPTVREFTKAPGPDWLNVKLALEAAIAEYQAPLASLSAWSSAGDAMARASRWSDYALALAAMPSERTHMESSDPVPIELGATVMGRFGAGDQLLPRALDRIFEGGLSDIYTLKISAPTDVMIAAKARLCQIHLTVVDASGKKLEGDGIVTYSPSIGRKLPPGGYQIWVSGDPGRACDYQLEVAAKNR